MAPLPAGNRRVTRVQLGIMLREWRVRAGFSAKNVAAEMDWYQSKVTKLEKGGVKISSAEVDKLIGLYQVSDDDADKMRSLGREARRRTAAQRIAEWAQQYVDIEQGADRIMLYDGELIPNMLATEEYARAVLATSSVLPEPFGLALDQIDEVAADRTARRVRLTGEDRPQLSVVLGEAVLHRLVGGEQVMCGQLRQLRELADLPNVTVQILKFSAGEHVALGGSFSILDLAEPSATFVYVEGLTDANYFDRPPHTDAYRVAFGKAQVAAADKRESKRLLSERIAHLE